MVKRYSITKTPELHIGIGARDIVGSLLVKRSRTLLVTGKQSLLNSIDGKRIVDKIQNSSDTLELIKIESEPTPQEVNNACHKFRDNPIDVVISIGGGSVIDAGKAISAMLRIGGNVKDYLEGVGDKIHSGSKTPFIAIPTTAGTGSEATANAVLSEIGDKGYKKSLRHAKFIPDYAIIDPELYVLNSFENTASTGMDALTQLIESYLSNKANTFTDMLAIEGIRNVLLWLEESCSNGTNLNARQGMAYAAYLSGITLANAGLGVVHGFAQPLGSMFIIPHGVICGTLMSATNKLTFHKAREIDDGYTIQKYANLGRLLKPGLKKNIEAAKLFIEFLENLTVRLKIPRLSDFGVTSNHVHKIIEKTDNKSHPIPLTKDDFSCILLERL